MLTFICFFSELISFIIWIYYFDKKINKIFILIFALLPLPLMFGFIHSSDIIFYLISTIIITRLINYNKIDNMCLFFFLLAALLRPASLSIIIVSYIYFIFFNLINTSKKNNFIILIIIMLSFVFYLPYFLVEINSNKVAYPYYFNDISLLQLDIFQNIFYQKIIIIFFKFFFLFGFDPSESGYNIIQLFRSIIGVVFFIGFLKTLFERKINITNFYIWFTILFISLFFYPTYRYIIPIMPLLYLSFFSRKNI